MLQTRVIPCLLLDNGALVKSVRFQQPQYVGDPINVVRIFNEMEVDELVFLDINVSKSQTNINYELIERIAGECFMPVAYGGGISDVETAKRILKLGVEKVIINTAALLNMQVIRDIAERFGSQSVVVSIDAKKGFFGTYQIRTHGGSKKYKQDLDETLVAIQEAGAGELLLTSIDRDGTWDGYDFDLIKRATSVLSIPVVACGGAGSLKDFEQAVHQAKASACAAGSMFVYQGKDLGVLVKYPERKELVSIFPELA